MQNFIAILSITCIAICAVYLIIQTLYAFLLFYVNKHQPIVLDSYPFISILVAARNESANIIECLESLNALDYPKDKIEIIVGNDQSTDYTGMLVENYIKDKPNFKIIHLSGKEYPKTKGKARVLATLAAEAKGEYFLITDADIEVPKSWALETVGIMVAEDAGICGGTTNIKANNLFEKFQQVDWLYFMGIIHTFATIKKPLTIVGNNMGISRKAYESTGGYGEIPFSITEDYALFDAVLKNGFKSVQKMHFNTMVYSKPLDSIKAVLKQRKRWLTGGWDLPLYYHIMIFIFGAWYIALPLLFVFDWKLALVFLIVKDLLQLTQILRINAHLGIKVEHPLAVFLYDLYLLSMIPITAAYFLLPTKNTWKGRNY